MVTNDAQNVLYASRACVRSRVRYTLAEIMIEVVADYAQHVLHALAAARNLGITALSARQRRRAAHRRVVTCQSSRAILVLATIEVEIRRTAAKTRIGRRLIRGARTRSGSRATDDESATDNIEQCLCHDQSPPK